MKIHLSPVWRMRAKCNLFLLMFFIVGPILYNLYYDLSGTDWFLMPSIGLFLGLIIGFMVFEEIRLLTYVIVEGHLFTSYSVFNKKMYILDITAPVFYRVLKVPQDLFYDTEFIALSNEQFEFVENDRRTRFISRYDQKALLVMPYNDKTKPLMQLEKWERIYELTKRV